MPPPSSAHMDLSWLELPLQHQLLPAVVQAEHNLHTLSHLHKWWHRSRSEQTQQRLCRLLAAEASCQAPLITNFKVSLWWTCYEIYQIKSNQIKPNQIKSNQMCISLDVCEIYDPHAVSSGHHHEKPTPSGSVPLATWISALCRTLPLPGTPPTPFQTPATYGI